MRRIYLVRHGRPDFPLDVRLCLGSTDLPLGALGRMQVCRTALWLPETRTLPAFSSPLSRAQETARFFTDTFTILPDLREMDGGDWEGLRFDEIRRRWPEVYAARGTDPTLPIPNAEPVETVRRRAMGALREAMNLTDGDLLIAAHSFVIRSILSEIGEPALLRHMVPYASVTTLTEQDGALRIAQIGQTPDLPLTPDLADALLSAAAPGERVEAHCRAVAREAVRIAEALPIVHNCVLLENAALLHDVARAQPEHAKTGARWLRELGYESAAYIVSQHHDHDSAILNEGAILYLADKCVLADQVVPLAERFAASKAKCLTEEAKEAHMRRLHTAERLRDEINALCRTEVVR